MSNWFCCFTARLVTRRTERGATATEYGLLVSFIALAILAGVTTFGTALNNVYDGFATLLGVLI
ncbi:MAG TPA: Flp family type IVb pilin [Nocardioides sp.]|nr:Flp family type IVb pilin [Nocardioides sp.]